MKVGLSLRKNSAIRCGTIILLKKKFMECRLDLLLMYCITIKIYLQRRGWKSRRMNGHGLICRMLQKSITEKSDAKGFAFQMKPDPYDFEIGSAGRSGATIE